MKKALVATPFATISRSMSSHRAAQGVIYADQIQEYYDGQVDINMSGDQYITDYSDYDDLFVYHGNDWGGSLNLFGGMENFGGIQNFVSFSNFKGKVYSLAIDMPDYYGIMMDKFTKLKEKGKPWHPDWDKADLDNLKRICETAETIDPNSLMNHDKIAIGDSHAICMYRRGWQVNSVPFKTLHGALKEDLRSFIRPGKYTEIEVYFGNIDVRHHLLRQPDPKKAVDELVHEYMQQATGLAYVYDCNVKLYELLPIENESRKVPKTGWYKGTPFYGSWKERNEIRKYFKERLKKECAKTGGRVTVYEWIGSMINSAGELDYEYMEKPQSIHLSRNWYPHWQGYEWSHAPYREYTPTPEKEQMSLEDFFA